MPCPVHCWSLGLTGAIPRPCAMLLSRAALRRLPLSRSARHLRATGVLREPPATPNHVFLPGDAPSDVPGTDGEIIASLMDKRLSHHKLEEELGDAECAAALECCAATNPLQPVTTSDGSPWLTARNHG